MYFDSEGFNLIELSEDTWIFESINQSYFQGSLKEVIFFAMDRHGFSLGQIEHAIEHMIRREHNAAHFGIMGSFIYSFHDSLSAVRLAS